MIILPKSIPAIILAAGASSRLGRPKALVMWKGETLVGRMVRMLKENNCSPIVVVTRKELQVDVMLKCPGASIVVNNTPEDGRTGSLQMGIVSLMEESGRIPGRIIVSPVDRCGWNSETLSLVLENTQNTSPIPSGHPLLLSDIEKVLSLPKDASLRDNLDIKRIPAPGIHMNIDTPEDLEALR